MSWLTGIMPIDAWVFFAGLLWLLVPLLLVVRDENVFGMIGFVLGLVCILGGAAASAYGALGGFRNEFDFRAVCGGEMVCYVIMAAFCVFCVNSNTRAETHG